MHNLSPGFNARFASIGLENQAPTPRARKQYPASLFPHNHPQPTPSATATHSASAAAGTHPASAAARAGGTPSIAAAATPSKAPRLSTAARAETRTSSRSNSRSKSPLVAPPVHKRKSHKDDDDARRKPVFSFMRATSSSRKKSAVSDFDRTFPQTRAASHSDLYTRHHPKKRQLSRSRPAEDRDKPALGPRRVSANGPDRENVYTRLYKSATERAKGAAAHASHHAPGSAPPHAFHAPAKLASTADMYRLLYKADRGFFTESNSLGHGLTPNKPRNAADLLGEGSLSVYERGEIMRSANLYYMPPPWNGPDGNIINISSFKDNFGFDDADGNYIIRAADHIEHRYEIVKVLGTGSFGNVVFCKDHKYSRAGQVRNVAVKIIKNELDWSLQAVSEIKMLKHLMSPSKVNNYVMNYCDHFHFRGHMCIVSEVLSVNLYTLLELNSCRGLSLALVRNFASKILKGLAFVHGKDVIHCDVKPENIMLKLPSTFDPKDPASVSDFEVKLIDFGSSCFESETSFSYIQSRFYRAPEVILGARYGYGIDLWSFGCVVAELFTGTPLLPGKNELEQIALILEMFGAPASAHVVSERRRLLRAMKSSSARNLNDPLVDAGFASEPHIKVDEKRLKKTLLYSLFNLEGKVNLPFLNLQLQHMDARDGHSMTASPFKRSVKIGSRSLDVALRLHSSSEDRQAQSQFSKFLASVFQWDARSRASAADLLSSTFLREPTQ